MLKKDRTKRKRNTNRTTRTDGKVLTRVSAFFDIQKLLIIIEIAAVRYSSESEEQKALVQLLVLNRKLNMKIFTGIMKKHPSAISQQINNS